MPETARRWEGVTTWRRLTQSDIEALENAWHEADLEEWQQYSVRPNAVVHRGALTDVNAICTAHGEKGDKTAAFIVLARNLMPLLLSAVRHGEDIR